MITDKILSEVRDERLRQFDLWGSDFDAHNTVNDWVAFIVSYASKAIYQSTSAGEQRETLIKVAASAVAAIDSFDRNGNFPPRHYDT